MPRVSIAYDKQTLTWNMSVSAVSAVTTSADEMYNLLHSFKLKFDTPQASAASAVYFDILDAANDVIYTTGALASATSAKTLTADVMLVGDVTFRLQVNTATGFFTAGQTAPTASVVLYLY